MGSECGGCSGRGLATAYADEGQQGRSTANRCSAFSTVRIISLRLLLSDKPLSLIIQKSPKVSGRLCSTQRIQPSHHQRTRSQSTPQLSSSIHTRRRSPIRQCHQCRPRRIRCFQRCRSIPGRHAAYRTHDCQWPTRQHCRQLSTAWRGRLRSRQQGWWWIL
jgi:hypothetical protein